MMLFRLSLVSLLLLLCPVQAGAVCYSYTTQPDGSYRRIDYPSLLWKVYAPGREDKASYLFGTMHMAEPEVTQKIRRLDPFFPSLKAVVLELLVSKQEVRADIQRRMLLPQGMELRSLIGEDRFLVLKHIFRHMPAAMEGINRLKPWAATLIASRIPQSLQEERATPGPVLDSLIELRTRQSGKTIGWLETAEEQMNVFDGLSLPEQLVLMDSSLKEMLSQAKELPQMEQHYIAENIQALYDDAFKPENLQDPVARKFMTRLNAKRNRVMAKRVNGVMYKGNTLVAVGVLHLPGEEGLLHRLEERGFCIEPMLPTTPQTQP